MLYRTRRQFLIGRITQPGDVSVLTVFPGTLDHFFGRSATASSRDGFDQLLTCFSTKKTTERIGLHDQGYQSRLNSAGSLSIFESEQWFMTVASAIHLWCDFDCQRIY